jgi:hypothetical protein
LQTRRLSHFLKSLCALALFIAGPAHATWYEAKSKHFIIYANENSREIRSYAEKLERFDSAVRYVRKLDDPALTDAGRVTIFVLPDAAAVGQLVGSSAVRGMYVARASGSVAFVPERSGVTMVQGMSGGTGTVWDDLGSDQVFFHEYAHHLQLQDSSLALPTWVVEGFAEFFATADIRDDGSVLIGKWPSYRDFAFFGARNIMLGNNFEKLDGDDQYESMYAWGWLLTHYLYLTDHRKGQFARYLDGIQQGMSPLESAKAAFGDFDALDRELVAYSNQRQLPALLIDARYITTGDVATRPLTAGEAAMMRIAPKLAVGIDDKDAADLAGDATKIADDYPRDAFVQTLLARADYLAKDYAGSNAAADRALAIDPRNIHALIAKGRAQIALAKANPTAADWNQVRGWFLKANRIDSEDPLPLELYWTTFVDAGQAPPNDAVDGLLYAVDLAPRDEQLRMDAVGQLLAQHKLQDAAIMFAPVAYAPHASAELRNFTAKAMQAMKSGDVAAALDLLHKAEAVNAGKRKN